MLVIKRKGTVVEPGQRHEGKVEFLLPPDLRPLHHYRAALQLYNAQLLLDIYTRAKEGHGGRADKDRKGGHR